MSEKKYWKDLNEFHATPEFDSAVEKEFKEELPFDMSGSLLEAKTPRRDFLKFLGFSTLAATVAASCEMPVRKVIPYAIKPENITPGVAQYFASTFSDGGEYCAVVVKNRDGRPIKIEGNRLSSVTKGATSARVQASILNLYDKARLRHPFINGEEATFEAVDQLVAEGLNGNIVLLTSSILSPSTKEVIAKFLAAYPSAKHVTYDAISYSGLVENYGGSVPAYRFDKANTIVSIGADFLGTWLSPVEYAAQYAKGRKVSAENPVMSKHYQFEALHTISGAAADYRATCKPSEYGVVANALLTAIKGGSVSGIANTKLAGLIAKAAKDLKNGNGLVVCGSNDKNVQAIVKQINAAISAQGRTIENRKANYKQGIDSQMVELVASMKAGQVNALLMFDVNPAYDFVDAPSFKEGMEKVKLTVSMAERMDETAQLSKVVAPVHNFLESWGDAEPKTGYYSLQQPCINPLFKTRGFQDSLLTWAKVDTTYEAFWNQYWTAKLGSQTNVDKALQDGVIEPSATTEELNTSLAAVASTDMSATTEEAPISTTPPPASEGVEIVVYEKISMGRGANWSNNPWLLELPDPITKATWDNYACVSPKRAKLLDNNQGIDAELTGINQVDSKKRVIRITVEGREPLELPIVVVPGMHNDVVAVALGFGRHEKVGLAAANTGKNAFPYAKWNGSNILPYQIASIEKTSDKYDIAITQTHLSYENRPIIKEYTLEEFKANPMLLVDSRKQELGHYAVKPWEHHSEGHGDEHGADAAHQAAHGHDALQMSRAGAEIDALEAGFRKEGTLYPDFEKPGIHWGMSIDLGACIGCGACVISCQAENNISVVGKTHVLRAQEMHWIRIDRYFSGMPDDPDTIQTVFQPMMCQHCDNAPCENVCPVNATNHSTEGLNQMAYNRCIGTKYCANNCPYKVRHFNWMDWNGADSFEGNLYEDGKRDDINDDLTRMVLNPDVTVRSRGVMEKCSFCVQRLQEAKLYAKKEGRPLQDGEATTACQTACPTNAIVFGNVNDKSSEIYKVRRSTDAERVYYVLEQIHTLPNVNYLAKIRNTDTIVAGDTQLDGLYNEHI